MSNENIALLDAVTDGDLEATRAALDAGADPNAKDYSGRSFSHRTALQVAVSRTLLVNGAGHAHLDAVRLLLDRGANIEAQNDYRETALIVAAAQSDGETVGLLLDRGASLAPVMAGGDSALMVAIKYGRPESVALIKAVQEARDLASTLPAAHSSTSHPCEREDLGAPDPKPDKPRRARL